MPVLTTFPWISSTEFPVRAPPTLSAISERLWLWSLSTSPATSSRPNRGRGSSTTGEPSSSARRSRWRAISSRWSKPSSLPATGGTRPPTSAEERRARHNMAYWLGRDYLGLGIGAVSTVGDLRWRNAPKLAPYLAALASGLRPPRELEQLD